MTQPTESRVPWRAGRYNAGYITPTEPLEAVGDGNPGPFVLLADCSEFQPDIVDAVYLKWSKAIIIRAAYGDAHDDKAWYGGARRADLHKGGVRFLGIYQYIVAGQDSVMQAQVLAALIGQLQPGERIIGDLEEGTGNQQGRWLSWASTIKELLGQEPWDYSGLNFANDHGLAPVDWVADYTLTEPTVQHKLWQFTDSFNVPGVGVADCSLFHGTIDQLAALGHQTKVFAKQPNDVTATPRWTNILLEWSGGTAPEGYTVYLIDGPDGHGIVQEKFDLPATATGYKFGHLRFSHTYTVGVWAKPGEAGVWPTWRTVTTR